jgi:hypothetical protein
MAKDFKDYTPEQLRIIKLKGILETITHVLYETRRDVHKDDSNMQSELDKWEKNLMDRIAEWAK